MFLIRLIYIREFKKTNKYNKDIRDNNIEKKIIEKIENTENKTIDQIKNFQQEEKKDPQMQNKNTSSSILIDNFEMLLNLCNEKKELKLKYELENNINLVDFTEGRIEISFNEKLDKNFIKDLSNKLNDWTNKRWIISLSKKKGAISVKEEKKIEKQKIFDDVKAGKMYKEVLNILPDADLINIDQIEKDD